MSASPHANGGLLLRPLTMPDFRAYEVDVRAPGAADAEATRVLGGFLRDVMSANGATRNFRLFGPDETASNRLDAVYEVTDKAWEAEVTPLDEHLGPGGRVMEVLSEHQCQGWLEGYLLTGRHGLFSCYEAFIHIVDSMVNQHAKWLKVTRELAWRRPIGSLNYLLTSHVWRQDHNGFSHQDPGLHRPRGQQEGRDRARLPAAGRQHAAVDRRPLPALARLHQPRRGRQAAGAAVAHDGGGGRPLHARPGHLGVGEHGQRRDARRGHGLLRRRAHAGDAGGDAPSSASTCPGLRVRVVNVVDLMRLEPPTGHPHGLPDDEFDALFTVDRPVIFAYHGYPSLIHRLTYKRANHHNMHVRGYMEEGTTTTPFDMVMLNDLDRFHLVMDVIDRVPGLGERRPTCASAWSTSACGRAPTRASTARTTPTSPGGGGRRRRPDGDIGSRRGARPAGPLTRRVTMSDQPAPRPTSPGPQPDGSPS